MFLRFIGNAEVISEPSAIRLAVHGTEEGEKRHPRGSSWFERSSHLWKRWNRDQVLPATPAHLRASRHV